MTGDGVDLDPDALARAEAALARLGGDYLHWVEADLATARACLDLPADLSRLYAVVHDIKGQAGTFGYPLVSQIGTRLCRLLREPEPSPAQALRLLDAMAAIIADRLEGDGGDRGREILSHLD